jgi:hypothetical protein
MDFVLRMAGVILAAGSIIFAAAMIGFNGSAGLARLFIGFSGDDHPKYALVTDSGRGRPNRRSLDFTALGSIASRPVRRVLPDFELLDCDGVTAQIRTPQGRVVRIRAGLRLAGAGEILSITRGHNGWVVTTREGSIVAH